jgi:hypothetical protein
MGSGWTRSEGIWESVIFRGGIPEQNLKILPPDEEIIAAWCWWKSIKNSSVMIPP